MTTKWTKEWRVSPNGSGYDIRDLSGNVCTTYAHSSEEANAQLIASAPALYEALEAAKQVFGNDQHSGAHFFNGENAAIARIDAALRAAKGENK